MKEKRNWLVFANYDKCHHDEALKHLGFINWVEGRVNMSKGDVVYLFVSNERRIRFKTVVVEEHVKREDGAYWQVAYSNNLTFKLKFVEEYNGHDLDEDKLYKYGFNGGKSIETPMCNNQTLFQYIESVFKRKSFAWIIDEAIHKDKSRELVRKIIPILIRWAKQGLTNMTYKHLLNELGKQTFSGIGKQLGYVDDILNKLSELTGEKIPTLNALVKSKSTGLPSEGFSYVYTTYNKLTESEKKIFVSGLNNKAIEYQQWDWVLSALDLTPSVINTSTSELAIRSGNFYGGGGEGPNHKKLKEYIYNHPEIIGIKNIKKRIVEYNLLSGDRLDIFFELVDGSKVAVEIKPSTSSDADVMRGLYQCVKYKTILDAEDKVHGNKAQNLSMLVLGGELSEENRKVSDTLAVCVLEKIVTK